MITPGDEYPIHQTPEPIAYAGTDRNFYDRFFFNGYAKEAGNDIFFAAALGVYPHLNIKDAAFCLILDGVQHNLRASTHLNMDRMDIQVGPLAVRIIKPLYQIGLKLSDNEHGLSADLVFTCSHPVVEEPRFIQRTGTRTLMDCTRMTQNGSWSGWIQLQDKRIEVDASHFSGTRDRSWGVRAIGARDPQAPVPETPAQFFWLWAPLQFDDRATFFGLNEYEDGRRWHESALCVPFASPSSLVRFKSVDLDYKMIQGTRHHQHTTLVYRDGEGGSDSFTIELKPRYHFYMSGLGYIHPEWGHGMDKGEQALGYDKILLKVPPDSMLSLHVQAVVDAKLICQNQVKDGVGVLEQLVIGPHHPSGLKDGLAMAS